MPYRTRCRTGRPSAKVRVTKSRRNFLLRMQPIHLIVKLTFGAFDTIWVHLRPFGCLTELGANQAELVQKFMPRSRVGIFSYERTRSTPMDPKLTFCCVLYYLGAFGTIWLPYETRCKTGRTVQKFMPRSRVRIFRNECSQSTPLDSKMMF